MQRRWPSRIWIVQPFDAETRAANCSVTEYAFSGQILAGQECITCRLALERDNVVAAVRPGGASVTIEPGATVAIR